jgi:hypothetical protein
VVVGKRERLPRTRYNYKGFWCDTVYDIEVNRRNDGKYVFVVTEPPNNPGTSVTDYGEHLATAVRRQHGLMPANLIWIEHHLESKDHPEEVFNLVRFLGMKGDSFRSPVWTRITEQVVKDLHGSTIAKTDENNIAGGHRWSRYLLRSPSGQPHFKRPSIFCRLLAISSSLSFKLSCITNNPIIKTRPSTSVSVWGLFRPTKSKNFVAIRNPATMATTTRNDFSLGFTFHSFVSLPQFATFSLLGMLPGGCRYQTTITSMIEIHGRNRFPMVSKEGQPVLGPVRISRRSLHPTGDGSLGKFKTEHAEFPMYPRRSPGGILNDHTEDQFANLLRCQSSSDLPPDPGDQSPIHTKASPVPADDGFGRDDDEGLLPS